MAYTAWEQKSDIGRNLGPEKKGKSLRVDWSRGPLRIACGRIAGLLWNIHLFPPW